MKINQLLILLISCLVTIPAISQNCGVNSSPGCTFANYDGSPLHSYSPYNCNQYVRAGVENNWINLSDGTYQAGGSASSIENLNNGAIKNDLMWIEVPSIYADAISSHSADHSALILKNNSNHPFAFASTAGHNLPTYTHSNANAGSGHCGYDYYAYMGGLSYNGVTTSMNNGNTRTFSFSNIPSYASVSWQIGPGLLIISGGGNSSSVTVQAFCGNSNVSSYVKGTLNTYCTTSTTDREYTKNFTINKCPSNCTGTINGSTLYTFNYLNQAINHIHMNETSQTWTWVKNSGYVNYWYTQNSGRDVYFSLNPGGYVSFSAWTTGCNNNFSFSRGFSVFEAEIETDIPVLIEYSIYNMSSGLSSSGKALSLELEQIKQALDPGLYIISTGNKKEKLLILD